MRTDRITLAAVAVAAAAVLLPTPAAAFCRTSTLGLEDACVVGGDSCCTRGKPLYWANACVGYSITTDGEGRPSRHIGLPALSSMLRTAFGTWDHAACEGGQLPSIAVSELPSTTIPTVEYNKTGPNANIVVLRDDVWGHQDDDNTLGLVTITFSPETGEIYDADMEINMADPERVSAYAYADPVPDKAFDFQSILTHEAGHFLALAHSERGPEALMYAHYQPGSIKRELLADDVLGICSMYPPRGVRTVANGGTVGALACDPTPRRGLAVMPTDPDIRHGCTSSPARAPTLASWTLGSLLALTLAALRRRSRR